LKKSEILGSNAILPRWRLILHWHLAISDMQNLEDELMAPEFRSYA